LGIADGPVTSMRILHSSALPSPQAVDGVNAVVWGIAVEQAKAGHEVAVALGDPTDAARELASRHKLTLAVCPPELRLFAARMRQVLGTWRPDVVHLHSVFTPRLAITAGLARRADIPYVATPHGGLAPRVLVRNRRRKLLYTMLVERRRLAGAGALTAVSPAEVDDLRSFVPRYRGPIEVIGNPVFARPATDETSRLMDGPVVFLGRFATEAKGLDRLLDVARRLPGVCFRIYGEGPDRDMLVREAPDNVTICTPVFGSAKAAVLAGARLYLQPSRWDALPMSLLEAMMSGVPCGVSQDVPLASVIGSQDLGLVLPSRVDEAAGRIEATLADVEQLDAWAAAGRRYAEAHYSAPVVAATYVELYHRVLLHRRGGVRT
jgi:glycosyltransferase involved in cell wall biosynthesis